jgi:hypothetical protein
MRKFNVCYPDANNFNNVIKLKSVDTWEAEYTKVDDDIGYWVAEDPFEDNGFELFKELVAQFPIVKDNNHPSNFDPNPFGECLLQRTIKPDNMLENTSC